jgi:crotonobetainyl-CoA:carnitine CoA-transferase CaiB-like acyl-CoA transferase
MERKKLIPDFGPLKNVRVLCSGSIVAMPHAANLMADFGAEVINIERPGSGDTYRGLAPFAKNGDKRVSTSWAQDARNRMSLTMNLDLNIPEIKEIFMTLIKDSDIYMENLVWLEKYGIQDEDLLAANPKLVIVHISGYGRPQFGGDPKICNRASYDMIGQAYSSYMNLNGDFEPAPPMLTKPWTNDYISALTAVFGALAAYISAQQTGKGQVVDVAQFEAMGRILSDTIVSYTEAGILKSRSGTNATAFQPYGLFKSKDDRWVAIGAFGPGVYTRFIKAIGLDPEYYTFKECASSPQAVSSSKGRELAEKSKQWCFERDACEIEEIINNAKVGCSTVMTAADVVEDPHWLDREDIIEYRDETLEKTIKAFGFAPKFSDTPGKVWRGAPTVGQDNEAILRDLLGYDDAKIAQLKEKQLV